MVDPEALLWLVRNLHDVFFWFAPGWRHQSFLVGRVDRSSSNHNFVLFAILPRHAKLFPNNLTWTKNLKKLVSLRRLYAYIFGMSNVFWRARFGNFKGFFELLTTLDHLECLLVNILTFKVEETEGSLLPTLTWHVQSGYKRNNKIGVSNWVLLDLNSQE